jgi:hypothetical protein
MAVKFTNTQEAAALNGVKVIVYGESGAGKTRMIATAPTPVIISNESGLLVLKDYQIPVMEIATISDLQEAYAWCSSSHEANNFETICMDSISEMAEVILANALAQVKDPRQAYGEVVEKMNATVRAFRDLRGKNVYMAAKMQALTDEGTGLTRFGPSMPGKRLGPGLPYFFDEVFYLGVMKDEAGVKHRYLQTQLSPTHVAKDRSGVLAEFEAANLSHIINKIKGTAKVPA